MNRKQAADFTGKSEKTISRAVANGKLAAERKENGELEIAEEELKRWKEESERLQPVQSQPHDEGETGQDSTAIVPHVSPISVRPLRGGSRAGQGLTLESLALAVVAIGEHLSTRDSETGQDKVGVPVSEKLLLTLEEAHQLSGLSAERLKKGIKDGQLKAKKEGRGWKMRRVDLEEFVDTLFAD